MKGEPNNPANTIGYDEPIALEETVQAAFVHGASVSPEDMERRRQRQRHHTVPVYLLRLFLNGEETRLHAFDQKTKQEFKTGPSNLLCENGANTVVGEDGRLRSDVEGVFAHTDYVVSKTVKRIVTAMRPMRSQLTEAQRTPAKVNLTLAEANSGSRPQWHFGAVSGSGTRTILTSGTWIRGRGSPHRGERLRRSARCCSTCGA